MKSITKKLILILFVIIILKIILSSFVFSPSAFSDEYTYSKMARSFFYSQEFTIHEVPTRQYLPLYPIILSISYLFKDMQIVYLVMKIINSIISSLIIIPSFLLAKEFISEKKALITALIISIYPANFSFSPLIMAENLYYPLFLFSIYFIYKEFTENKYKWSILSGISIALTTLTKINGIILIPILLILYLYKIINRKFIFKSAVISIASFVILMIPWLLRNLSLFGSSTTSIFGGYSAYLEKTTFSFPSFLMWLIIYTGIIIISTGFIYSLLNIIQFKNQKNEKLTYFRLIVFISTLLTLIIAANATAHSPKIIETLIKWLTWRPITRTIDVIAPLIIINGMINIDNINKIKRKTMVFIFTIISIIFLITTQITFFQLLPFNNISLVLLGIINKGLWNLMNNPLINSFIFLIILISPLFLIYILSFKNKINFKNVVIITILFFSMSSIANYTLISYNANKYWYNDDQMQLGIWLNKYDEGKSTVLIDNKNEGRILKIGQTGLYEKNQLNNTVTKIGFFMNNRIVIGNINNTIEMDYIISKNRLNLPIMKNEKDIFIYKA